MQNDNDQITEDSIEYQYTQLDRNKTFPPPMIWQDLMGVAPQRRRAYLLQNQYLTPLTFEYAVFTFFVRYVMLCVTCGLLAVLYVVVGQFNRTIYACVIVGLISMYLGYQWSASKNTKTIKEEIIFNTLVNTLALFFAVYTVFDLDSFFAWLFSSPFK